MYIVCKTTRLHSQISYLSLIQWFLTLLKVLNPPVSYAHKSNPSLLKSKTGFFFQIQDIGMFNEMCINNTVQRIKLARDDFQTKA